MNGSTDQSAERKENIGDGGPTNEAKKPEERSVKEVKPESVQQPGESPSKIENIEAKNLSLLASKKEKTIAASGAKDDAEKSEPTESTKQAVNNESVEVADVPKEPRVAINTGGSSSGVAQAGESNIHNRRFLSTGTNDMFSPPHRRENLEEHKDDPTRSLQSADSMMAHSLGLNKQSAYSTQPANGTKVVSTLKPATNNYNSPSGVMSPAQSNTTFNSTNGAALLREAENRKKEANTAMEDALGLNKKKKKKKKAPEDPKDYKKGKGRGNRKGGDGGNSFVFSSSSVYGQGGRTTCTTSSGEDDSDSRSHSKSASCHRSQGMLLSQGGGANERSCSQTGFSTATAQTKKQQQQTANKSSTDEDNRWWRLTLRQQAWLIFLVLEAFLIQNIFFIIAKYQFAVKTIMLETTKKELALMDITYNTKLNQMAFGFHGQSQNLAINELLKLYNAGYKVENSTDFGEVRSILVGEVTQRQIEYATLVSLDKTILVNANDDRLGEFFDPLLLVTAVMKDPTAGQLVASGIVPYDELKHENPPLFRERLNVLQPTALNHPFDTERDALVRYTATPVFDKDDEETLLGVIVSGDIVDGKVPITFDTVYAFEGGLAEVFGYNKDYVEVHNSTKVRDKHRKYWTASSMLGYDLDWTGLYESTTEAAIKGIGYSATANYVPNTLLDTTLDKVKAGDRDRITTQISDEFVFAAKSIPLVSYADLVVGDDDEEASVEELVVPAGFLVRGAAMGPDEKGDLLTSSFGMVLIFCGTMIALFDAVCIFGSIFLFIAPLEKLAQRVLRKKKIRSHHAKTIQRKAYLIGVIILIAMCSIWPSVYFYYVFTDGMTVALEKKSKQELGVATVMYQLKVDQMGFEFSGVAQNGAIRDLLDYPDELDYQRRVQEALSTEVKRRKIEYATLVDDKMRIVWSPNNNGMEYVNDTWYPTDSDGVIGDLFNPFDLVAQVLETGNRYKVSELLDWAILEVEEAPKHQEKLDETIDNSHLHPEKTEDLALIRYTATPVYATSTAASSALDSDGRLQSVKPDGVLIAADIVNGKTIINEQVINVLETGYSAVYIYGAKCDKFFLASSVYNPSSSVQYTEQGGRMKTTLQVDVPLPDGVVKSLLRPVMRRGGKQSVWGSLGDGKMYVFSAKLINDNQVVSPTAGGTSYPLSSNFGFVVYGSPLREMEGLIADQKIWLATLIAVQCIKVVVIAGLCFVAYKPMYKLLGTMKVYAISHKV